MTFKSSLLPLVKCLLKLNAVCYKPKFLRFLKFLTKPQSILEYKAAQNVFYVPRYFEALSKILRNVGILVCSKPHLTLKEILPKAKDSI